MSDFVTRISGEKNPVRPYSVYAKELPQNWAGELKHLLRVIAVPRTPGQWFLRRIFLERREDEFRSLRKTITAMGGSRSFGTAFWPAARMMGYEGKDWEKKRCLELEDQYELNSSARVMLLKKEEELQRRLVMAELDKEGESSYYEDVRWAFQNWPRFLRRKDGEWKIIDEEELIRQAPSNGAYGLIIYALENLKEFQALAARVLAKAEVPEGKTEAEITKADLGIDDLKRVVEGL